MISQKKLDFLYKKHELVDIHVEPGDILFFHSSIVHGSSHNASPNSRSIILSQLNTFSNLPKSVQSNAVKFNLKRSKIEYLEAKRRLKWFENKFLKQKKTKKITFSAPIPFEEK
jgi:ectoine hydroxylase-related dioxygenase (phytanoyl-CoA dioxygenase family)